MGKEDFSFDIGTPDFGNLGYEDVDKSLFNFDSGDFAFEDRYLKPKASGILHSEQVLYDNAEKLASKIEIGEGERADVIVSGAFIFGDFIEAYITQRECHCLKMTISTLSLSQDNVDSLRNLLVGGYVDKLDMVVSAYFYSNEIRTLIPYMYRQLDIDDKFQLAVCGTHTKTTTFETEGGKHIVVHGSANLRSSANIEQFTIEDNKELYDFYENCFGKIVENYSTIQKPIRVSKLWKLLDGKNN